MGIGNPLVGIAVVRRSSTSLPLMGIGNAPSGLGKRPVAKAHCPSWGLGTRSEGKRDRRSTGLITPHGDWEPLRAGRLSVYRPGLITPHGDWEPVTTQPANRFDAVSLPLMGIGNAPAVPECVIGGLLITPHGDWERRTFANLSESDILITPHGDWEPPPCLKPRRKASLSLPLMGIGNSGWTHRWQRGAASHYPSWGLGTVLEVVRSVKGPVLITPHGDWEPVSARSHSTTAITDLITPHGDWEPWYELPPLTRSARSLPLMGIGNGVDHHVRGNLQQLITPHGDWERERQGGPGGCRVLITPHGDWEPGWHLERAYGVLPLITPHGDWELPPLR